MGKKGKTVKGVAIGAMLAGIGGYIAGVLTAPKSGKATRRDIKEGVDKSLTDAEKELKRLHAELGKLLESAKVSGSKLQNSVRQEFTDLVSDAKQTEAKAREVLGAVQEGDAKDKDLQQAIKDAVTAIDHIKKYLKKD